MGRKGYDLTYIARKCPPRNRENCEQNHSTSRHPPSILLPLPPSFFFSGHDRNRTNNNTVVTTNTYRDQNGFLTPPLYHSRAHTLHQQPHCNQRPLQRSRLSPGYARTTGQYALYNQRTGRGWQRSKQATSTIFSAIGTAAGAGAEGAAAANQFAGATGESERLAERDPLRSAQLKLLAPQFAPWCRITLITPTLQEGLTLPNEQVAWIRCLPVSIHEYYPRCRRLLLLRH
ncbi:hypothetical protein F4776DRAFT_666513 [Hypoxylon sp. NC0597]|nr:hypothetical protein F4776DRAFT_666513 [Hypoxylon sp. NC0597]